ncbi:hypothetical protein F4693_000652 [Sphingomonas endophytica]|uniref:Autotransporter domain-containing protein n=2 Tax=Sphingomonas endophytica TaxID=869719 RepID=A0A7X0JBR8_9SPHN|nr:hypothetical protein [Sphingomonas endophytica]
MSVFLINSSGITFGPTGVVNVGSLIASTLDLSPADFAADVAAGRFAFAGSGSGDIKVAGGARLFAIGSAAAGLGNLVLLGAKVAVGRDSGGTAPTLVARNGVDPDAATIAAPTGDDGDVALIAADDVTVEMGTGSPLSIAIAKGTAVEGAFKVDGSIAGRNVTLALATRGGVTDTLLSVAGMTTATGAASTDRGVVLTAGRGVTGAVTLAPAVPADIDTAGAVRTTAQTDSRSGLAIAAAGDVTVAAISASPMTKAVDVADDYAVTGSAVTLGVVGTLTEQSAGGAMTIEATGGNIIGRAGLTLRAGPGAALTLATSGTSGGDIDFATGTALIAKPTTGTTPARGAVQVRSRDAANLVTLGTVNAGSLLGAVGTTGFTTGITRTSAITVGDVTLAAPLAGAHATLKLDAGTAALETGTLDAATITLNAGDLTLGGITAGGQVTLTGDGVLDAGGIAGVTGLTIDRSGSVALAGVTASGNILVGQTPATRPTTITTTGSLTATGTGNIRLTGTDAATIQGAVSATGDYAVTGSAVTLGTVGTPTEQSAGGAVTIEATGSDITGRAGLTLQSNRTGAGTAPLTIVASAAGGGTIDFTGAALQGGNARQSAVRIAPGGSASIVTLGDVSASALQGDIVAGVYQNGITRDATLRFGTLDLATSLVATSNMGDIRLGGAMLGTGQGITLSAANGALVLPTTLSASGAIRLTAGADVTTGSIASTGATLRIDTGGNILSATSLTGATGLMIGAGAVTLGSGSGGTGALEITADTLDGGGTTARTGLTTDATMTLVLSGAARLGTLTAGSIDGAASEIDLTGATATGDILLNAGGLLSFGTVTGTGTADLIAGGALTGTAASGVARITARGLSADVGGLGSTNGAVSLATTGGDARLGTASAGTSVDVAATGGAASVTGTVEAGGNYTVSGTGVTLGAGAATIFQAADGAVTVTATNGMLAAGSGLSLRANADTSGAEALTLVTDGGTGGDIAFAGGLQAGPSIGAGSTLTVRSRNLANAVTLGDIVAQRLTGAADGAADETGLRRTGTIRTGAVALGQSLVLNGGGTVDTGAVSAGAIDLTAQGTLTATSLTANSRAIILSGSGDTIVTGAVVADDAGADIRIDRDGIARFGSLSAGQDLLIGQAGTLPTTLNVTGTTRAGRDVTIATGGAQTYTGAVTANLAATLTGATLVLDGGIAATTGALTLEAEAGDLTLATLDAGTDATLIASGTARVTGEVDLIGDYMVTGASVVLGTAGTPVTHAAGRAVTITATGGTLTGASGLTLRSGPTAALMLATTGTSGGDIALAGTTLSTGGTGNRGAVLVRSRDALNIVTLGTVNAGSLLGAVGGAAFTTGIARTAAITVADVTLAGAPTSTDTTLRLDAGSAALVTGTLSAPTITLNAGDLTLGGVTGSGQVTLTGSGILDAGGIAGVTGLAIDRGGSMTLAGVTAGGDILIGQTPAARPTTITTTGALTATTGAIRLASSGAQNLAGAITVGDDATIASGGALTLGTLNAGGTATLTGAGLTATSLTAGNLTATSGIDVMIGAHTTNVGGATIAGTGTVSIGGIASIAGDYRVSGASVILGSTTRAGAVVLTGTGTLDAAAMSGIASLSVDRGGSVALAGVSASGNIQVGQTTRPATITTTGALTSAGGAIRLTSSGAQILGGAIGANGAVMLAGRSIAAGSISSMTGAIGASATGSAQVANASSAGDTIVTAGGLASVTGSVDSGADYRVTGSGVILGDGGTVTTQGARGSVRLLSTSGTIAGGSGLTLQGDRAGTGTGMLVLDGAGGITFDPAALLLGGTGTGTGDIGLHTGSGAGIALGTVTARRLTGADSAGALTATLLASGTLDLAGTVTTTATLNASAAGTITTRRIDVTGVDGDLILASTGTTADLLARGPLTATRDIGLTANRDLGFTTVLAGRGAGATATTGALTGTALTGATIARAVAAGAVSLTTLAAQTRAEARGATVTLTDAGTVNGLLTLSATAGGLTATSAVSTGGVVALSGAGDIALGSASAGSDLTIVGARDVGGIASGTRTTLSAGRDIIASARGTMRGTTFTAGRDLVLTPGALNLLAGSVTGGSATISAGSAAIGALTVGDATITTTGDAALGRIDSSGNSDSGDLAISAGGRIDGGSGIRSTLTAGRNLTLAAGGAALLGLVGVGGQAALRTASLDLSTLTANAASITATAGDALAGSLTTTGALDYSASGLVKISMASAGGLASIAGRSVDLTKLSANTASITATAGDAIAGSLTTTGGLRLMTADALTADMLNVAGRLVARGGSVTIAGTAAGSADIASTAGLLDLTRLTTGGSATLDATGSINFGMISAGGTLTASATRDIIGRDEATLTSTTGAVMISTKGVGDSGGTIRLNAITAATDLTVTGRQIAVTNAIAYEGSATLSVEGHEGATTTGTVVDRVEAGKAATLSASRGTNAPASASNGAIRLGSATARGGTLRLSADGDLRGLEPTIGDGDPTGTALTATGAIAATIGGIAELSVVRAGGDLSIDAGELRLVTAKANGAMRATTGNSATIGSVIADSVAITTRTGALNVTSARATDALALTSGTDLSLEDGIAGGPATLTATGTGRVTGLQARNATIVGNTLLLGRIATSAALTATSGAGGAMIGTVTTGTTASFASDDALAIGTVASDGAIVATALGTLTADSLTSGLATNLTAQATAIRALSTGDALDVRNGIGALAIGESTIGTVARITTIGDARVDTLTAGGDLTLIGQHDATLGTIASTGGAAALSTAVKLTVTGLSAARSLAVAARSATIGTAAAGEDVSLSAASGDLSLASLTAGKSTITATESARIYGAVEVTGELRVRAGTIALGTPGANIRQRAAGFSLTANNGSITGLGALTLSAGGVGMALTATGLAGAIDLAATTALDSGGILAIETAGTATLGSIGNRGSTVTVSASDIALAGSISADTITLVNRSPARTTRLGDLPVDNEKEFGGRSAARFDLTTAEIGRLAADQVIINAQTGPVTIGDVALPIDSGRTLFQIRTSGRMDVLGRFEATGSSVARTIVLGGGADNDTRASLLRVAASAGAGGRLLVGNGTLDMRADAVGVGLDRGFLDAIGLDGSSPSRDVAVRYVSQSGSGLYDASQASSLGSYSDPLIVQAGRLIVRYGDFALFQNTGVPGTTSGVVVGGIGQQQSLQLFAAAPVNAVALFGSINGVTGNAASLLPSSAVVVGDGVLRANSRLNGCLIGSDVCTTMAVTRPTFNSFDRSRLTVFHSGAVVSPSTNPIIISKEEALLPELYEIEASTSNKISLLHSTTICSPEDKPCAVDRRY